MARRVMRILVALSSTLTRDFVSIIGPSGVDKTTIFNIIA
jgi:ABC-type nitrate/sulfonate/bicarbonate transport system ATPase subunit